MTAFLGYRSSTLNVGSGGVVTYDAELFDTDSVLDAATGVVTIPGSWDQEYGVLIANLDYVGVENPAQVVIEKSTDGGTVWNPIASSKVGLSVDASSVNSGVLLFEDGHKYRVSYNGSSTVLGGVFYTNFGGFVINQSAGTPLGFEAQEDADAFIAANGVLDPAYGTVIFDTTSSGYDGSTGVFTVDASLDGRLMIFTAAAEMSSLGRLGVGIRRSTDGGTTWDLIGRTWNGTTTVKSNNCSTGPWLLATGDKFRMYVSNSNATGRNILAGITSFFSGMTVD